MASLREKVGMETKEKESSILSVWAVGFHNVTVRSRLAQVLKLTALYVFQFFDFFRVALKRG